jgi:5-methyltetrahydrofolate--homocysteine methyltransferase
MSISTRVDDASYRGVTFDEMVESYYQQVAALVEAGVDILIPETVVDTLNLKACLFAISRYFDERSVRVPVMVSGTFSEGGATFVSGQEVEAFWNAVAHFPMLSVCDRTWKRCNKFPRDGSAAIPTPACRMKWANSIWARPTWLA